MRIVWPGRAGKWAGCGFLAAPFLSPSSVRPLSPDVSEKQPRDTSAYNIFMRDEVKRIKVACNESGGREALEDPGGRGAPCVKANDRGEGSPEWG